MVLCFDRARTKALLNLVIALIVVLVPQLIQGQSSTSSVIGVVTTVDGAVVVGARVELIESKTKVKRAALTDQNGEYRFPELSLGEYGLFASDLGFKTFSIKPFLLTLREMRRIDVRLLVETESIEVNVEASSGGLIQTDSSSISVSIDANEIGDLPALAAARSAGSTSPLSALSLLPGVQTDPNGKFSVAGSLPGQLAASVDGISVVGPATLGVLPELLPSLLSVEQIQAGEVINPAELGGVADISAVSKSGGDRTHGGAFELFGSSAMNAGDPFSSTNPTASLHDFGGFVGGPFAPFGVKPQTAKLFYFSSAEILLLRRTTTAVESVPTLAMRSGDLSAYSSPLTRFPGNRIPASLLSPYSQSLLAKFFPLPNYGGSGSIADNYLASFNTPITSAQFDIRLDASMGMKDRFFAKYAYKVRHVTGTPVQFDGVTPGSPLEGVTHVPETDQLGTFGWNHGDEKLFNEFRVGASSRVSAYSFGEGANEISSQLGLDRLPGAVPEGSALPGINISGFVQVQGQSQDSKDRTIQIADSLTYSIPRHIIKMGGDYRRLQGNLSNVFANFRLGSYLFNGSALSGYLGNGPATPLAEFLLGYPDVGTVATVTDPDLNSSAQHYALFAQDDWQPTGSLTINAGLRYEYHPMFVDSNGNVANFLPAFQGQSGSQTVNGAVVIPDDAAKGLVDSAFAASIYPTPILTASQAGIPRSLRYSANTDFAPRLGFAWRPQQTRNLVVRGGYGLFIEALLGSAVQNGWAVSSSDLASFTNSVGSNGAPTYQLPYAWPTNIAQPGSQTFSSATDLHYRDPYVNEWDLTLELGLEKATTLRLSYDGNSSKHLGISENLNQTRPNTVGTTSLPAPNSPFPLWQVIQYRLSEGSGNYNSATVSLERTSTRALGYHLSYVFAKNLSNVNGVSNNPADSYASETGGFISDPYNPRLDYGNVPYTRRNRLVGTLLYTTTAIRQSSIPQGLRQTLQDWSIGGILLAESGPFLTVTTLNDPSGTGYNLWRPIGGRADRVQGISPAKNRSVAQWVNPASFAAPANNVGRFGDSSPGAVEGPGTLVVSNSIDRSFGLGKSISLKVGADISNVLNHRNYQTPASLTVGVAGFGAVTSLQNTEGAGPRIVQLHAHFEF